MATQVIVLGSKSSALERFVARILTVLLMGVTFWLLAVVKVSYMYFVVGGAIILTAMIASVIRVSRSS